jgi:hypothetical protein
MTDAAAMSAATQTPMHQRAAAFTDRLPVLRLNRGSSPYESRLTV